MAFDFKGWTPAGGNTKPGSAPGCFNYKTTDALTVVDTVNYFLPIRDQLNPGDIIWCVTVDGTGAVTAAGWLMVVERTATTVDTTNAVAFALTDSR